MLSTKRQTFLALLAVGFLAAAGCSGDDGGDDDVATLSDDGSADSSDEAGGDDPEAEMTEWARCMRGEGVDIPDPVQDEDGNWIIEGPGISIGGGGASFEAESDDGEGASFGPEEMQAADSVCGPPPAIGEFSEQDLADMEAEALEFAECMRDEGIDDFPDPDFSEAGPGGAPQTNSNEPVTDEPEAGGPAGSETAVVMGPFGELDMDDPATAAAFDACQDMLGGPGGPDGPGGPGGLGPNSDGPDA